MSWRNALRDFSKLPERPELDEAHQSTVAGVYVIGDLADAPILKAALAQGEAVGRAVALGLPATGRVLVVGAGPAGVAHASGGDRTPHTQFASLH
jgi:thioredoxin reductase